MSQDVFSPLLSTPVAGLAKCDMKSRLGELEDGPVGLAREPGNPYDPNAIKVVYPAKEGPQKLGYVPAVFCPMLINLRAAGYDVRASITTSHLPHTVDLHFTIESKS
jgi:hypothetical protein